MQKRYLALAMASSLCASPALAAAKAPRTPDQALTRAEFAMSLKALVDDLEKASRTSWKIETPGAYALSDVEKGSARRTAILALVNDYRLWDGAGAITHERFKPNEAVTRAEAERVLRNLWMLKTKVQPSTTPPPNLAIASSPKAKAPLWLTKSQFAAWAGTTFGLIKESVRLARERKEAQEAAAREAAEKAAREEAARVAAEQKAEAERQAAEAARQAEEARRALAEQEAQARARLAEAERAAQQAREEEARARQAEAERAAQAEREAQKARSDLAAREVADELRQRAAELEAIVARAQAEAARDAERNRRLQQDLLAARKADRFMGLRPVALQLSDMPYVSTSVPSSPWLGPTARLTVASYLDDLAGHYDLFGIGEGKAAIYPGGPSSLKLGAGPQGPIFGLADLAGLQFQPYLGGQVNFVRVGSGVDARGGPIAGMIAHLRAGRVGLYGSAEAMLPWTAGGISFQPTSTFMAGAEVALSREVALLAGWTAEYGASWLPYNGSLTTGVQLGF